MGRGKVEMKRIEDRHSRHVAFSKRRIGLMKKASELSVLCDVEVALIVFSGSGNLYYFCSPNRKSSGMLYGEEVAVKNGHFKGHLTCLDNNKAFSVYRIKSCVEKTLERYRTYNEEAADKDADKPKSPTDHASGLGTGGEPLELMSNLKVEHLTMKELTRVERKLDAILRQTRQKKTQLMMETLTTLAEEERQLREEKHVLEDQIGAMIDRQTGHVHSRQNDKGKGKELQPI